MGQLVGVIRACNCCKCMSDFNRYALNSAHCSSKCSDCCELSVDTDEIDLPEGSDEELEVEGCVKWHKS